jgi:hypothetical protein
MRPSTRARHAATAAASRFVACSTAKRLSSPVMSSTPPRSAGAGVPIGARREAGHKRIQEGKRGEGRAKQAQIEGRALQLGAAVRLVRRGASACLPLRPPPAAYCTDTVQLQLGRQLTLLQLHQGHLPACHQAALLQIHLERDRLGVLAGGGAGRGGAKRMGRRAGIGRGRRRRRGDYGRLARVGGAAPAALRRRAGARSVPPRTRQSRPRSAARAAAAPVGGAPEGLPLRGCVHTSQVTRSPVPQRLKYGFRTAK